MGWQTLSRTMRMTHSQRSSCRHLCRSMAPQLWLTRQEKGAKVKGRQHLQALLPTLLPFSHSCSSPPLSSSSTSPHTLTCGQHMPLQCPRRLASTWGLVSMEWACTTSTSILLLLLLLAPACLPMTQQAYSHRSPCLVGLPPQLGRTLTLPLLALQCLLTAVQKLRGPTPRLQSMLYLVSQHHRRGLPPHRLNSHQQCHSPRRRLTPPQLWPRMAPRMGPCSTPPHPAASPPCSTPAWPLLPRKPQQAQQPP